MDTNQLVNERIHKYYWEDDINCATTTLKILAESVGLKIEPQVIDGAVGLHGAGGFGAQCGLVEGTLLFIGILGRKNKVSDSDIIAMCYRFAEEFEKHFGSLSCSMLRPQGTGEHLCEKLTQNAIKFAIDFIQKW